MKYIITEESKEAAKLVFRSNWPDKGFAGSFSAALDALLVAEITCPECHGIYTKCSKCDGSGRILLKAEEWVPDAAGWAPNVINSFSKGRYMLCRYPHLKEWTLYSPEENIANFEGLLTIPEAQAWADGEIEKHEARLRSCCPTCGTIPYIPSTDPQYQCTTCARRGIVSRPKSDWQDDWM